MMRADTRNKIKFRRDNDNRCRGGEGENVISQRELSWARGKIRRYLPTAIYMLMSASFAGFACLGSASIGFAIGTFLATCSSEMLITISFLHVLVTVVLRRA